MADASEEGWSYLESEPSHYAALGLKPGAGVAAVRAAYRQLALRLHPDRNPPGRAEAAAAAFSRVASAHALLTDEAARRRYDEGEASALWRTSQVAARNRALEREAAAAVAAPGGSRRSGERAAPSGGADVVVYLLRLRDEGPFGWRVSALLHPASAHGAAALPPAEWAGWTRLLAAAAAPSESERARPSGGSSARREADGFRCFHLPSAASLGFTAEEGGLLGLCATVPRAVSGASAWRGGLGLTALCHAEGLSAPRAAIAAVWLGAMLTAAGGAAPGGREAEQARARGAAEGSGRAPSGGERSANGCADLDLPLLAELHAGLARALQLAEAGGALQPTRGGELGWPCGPDGGELARALGARATLRLVKLLLAGGSLLVAPPPPGMDAGGGRGEGRSAAAGCDGAALAAAGLLQGGAAGEASAGVDGSHGEAEEAESHAARRPYPPLRGWAAVLPSLSPFHLPLLRALHAEPAPPTRARSVRQWVASAPDGSEPAAGPAPPDGAPARERAVRQWVAATSDPRLGAAFSGMAAAVLTVAQTPEPPPDVAEPAASAGGTGVADAAGRRAGAASGGGVSGEGGAWRCTLALAGPARPGASGLPPLQAAAAAAAAPLTARDEEFATSVAAVLARAAGAEGSGRWEGSAPWLAAEVSRYVGGLCAAALAAMSARSGGLAAASALSGAGGAGGGSGAGGGGEGALRHLLAAYSQAFVSCWLHTPAFGEWARREGVGAAAHWLRGEVARAAEAAERADAAGGKAGRSAGTAAVGSGRGGGGGLGALVGALGLGAGAPTWLRAAAAGPQPQPQTSAAQVLPAASGAGEATVSPLRAAAPSAAQPAPPPPPGAAAGQERGLGSERSVRMRWRADAGAAAQSDACGARSWSGSRAASAERGEPGATSTACVEVLLLGTTAPQAAAAEAGGASPQAPTAGVEAECFVGAARDGRRRGFGVAIGARDSYAGQWADGLAEGEGVWRAVGHQRAGDACARGPGGALQYEGSWARGARHGFGSQLYRGGARYDGEWQAGVRAGVGTARWPDGSLYAGEWADDAPCGEGLRAAGAACAFVGSSGCDDKDD